MLVTIHFHCFVQTSVIFRVSLVQDVSHLDLVVWWLIGTYVGIVSISAKWKRRGRHVKAWKEMKSYASLPRASPVLVTF